MIIPFEEGIDKVINQFSRGIFLTAGTGGRANVMTIGWCLAGYLWNRNIFQIVVKTSRHSFHLLNEGGEFGVSIPLRHQYEKELAFCGSASGSTTDKFTECPLPVLEPRKISVPLIGGCERYYECRIITSQKLPLETVQGETFGEDPNDGHHHVMFYGEVRSSY